jgi:hypothetical protein
MPDAFQVHVRVGRPWGYRAGQYVYLCLCKGLVAQIQSHLYFVSWWYVDEDSRDVIVLIIGRQNGFSSCLSDHSNDDLILTKRDEDSHLVPAKDKDSRLLLASDAIKLVASVKADIEGLYRQDMELVAYETVLLFASGTGITGVLLFIRQLLAGYHNQDTKIHKLTLFWEIKSDRRFGLLSYKAVLIADSEHMLWLRNWMTDMLNNDTNKVSCHREEALQYTDIQILGINIYIADRGSRSGLQGDSGTRTKIHYSRLNITDIIERETSGLHRRAIALCEFVQYAPR